MNLSRRHFLSLGACGGLAATGLLNLPGCGPDNSKPIGPAPTTDISDDDLRRKLDDAIDYTYLNRHLDVDTQAAWQIMHGVLAYGRDFKVKDKNGEFVSAVDYALNGKPMRGFVLNLGEVLDPATGQQGIRSTLDLGSKAGQGHVDQWLGYTSGVGLTLDTPVMVDGKKLNLGDWIEQAKRDVSENPYKEYSWTVMSFCMVMPSDAKWKAADGQEWSIERLVKWESEQDIYRSACGGTHRLVAICMAYNRHVAAGGKIEGGWKVAHDIIEKSVKEARQFQNADGSFSSNYLSGPGSKPDLADTLGTSGHVLEFVVQASSDEQLRQPWVKKAVVNLCDLFRKTKGIQLECGALYHAAHGLVLYRERVFGKHELPAWTGGAKPATNTAAG